MGNFFKDKLGIDIPIRRTVKNFFEDDEEEKKRKQQGMIFKVGENLTPEQTRKANITVAKTDPYRQTEGNFFKDFVKSIPGAAKKVNQAVIVDTAQSITRNVASVGISATQGLTQQLPQFFSDAKNSFLGRPQAPRRPVEPITLKPDNFLHKAVFGEEDVKDMGQRVSEWQGKLKEVGTRRNIPVLKTDTGAATLGFAAPFISAGLDIFTGGGKKKVVDEVSKAVAKIDDVVDIGKQFEKLGWADDVIQEVSETFRSIKDPEIVSNMIENISRGFKPRTVVQVVRQDGNLVDEFYTVPTEQADDIIRAVDGSSGGIAGKNKDGLFYHITAKTPLEMERLGFKNAGTMTTDAIEAIARAGDEIVPAARSFGVAEDIVSAGNKVRTPITFAKNFDEAVMTAEDIAAEIRKDNVLVELENARAGKRFMVEVPGQGGTREVFKEGSTFPKWIPEDLRKTSVLKPVLNHIKNDTLPTSSRQVELYDVIAERMGINQTVRQTPPPQQLSPGQAGREIGEVPYTPSVAQSPRMRERGFLTSLKENPMTAAYFADEVDEYERIANIKTVKAARDLINNDGATANAIARSNDIGLEAQATRILMLEDAVKAGDINEARRIARYTDKSATEAGQAVQINKILGQNLENPAEALVTASNMIADSVKKTNPKFGYKTTKAVTEIKKVNSQSIDEVIREIPELKIKAAKEVPVKPTKVKNLEEAVEARGIDPAEELAARITPFTKTKKPNPIKEMVNTLYAIAKEELPNVGKKPPRKAIDVIGQALRDNETYRGTWARAQAIVREKYAGDPKALELLDKYFDRTLRSGVTVHAEIPVPGKRITAAIKEGMKEEGIDLAALVRKHYTQLDDTARSLTLKLVQDADVPIKEATALTQKIDARFKEIATAKKRSVLKSMFPERAVAKDKGFVDRIIEMTNLGAFDEVEFTDRIAMRLGMPTLTTDVARQIVKQSEVLQGMEFGYEKHKATQKLLKIISDQIPMTKGEIAGELINIPRTLMSSFFDFSFGLRQGIFAAWSFPKEFGGAWKKQFKAFGAEKHYEKLMDVVMKDPSFRTAQKAGVSFTDLGAPMAQREESYMSSFAEKIPLIGRGVRMTGRAYVGMANKLRMDMFTSMVMDAERLGMDLQDPTLLKNIAEFVNMSTGRGNLGKLERIAPVLNGIFFSPRLMASRLSLLNPAKYVRAEPFVRKQMVKSLLTFAGGTTLVLGAASFIPGVTVGHDWRSADFGKIKIGDTRIDIMGGFQQYIRMAGQLITGEYISSTTGKLTVTGEGYKPLTRWDILWRQVESKEAPVASFITAILKQQDYAGEKVSWKKEVAERFTPMIASTFYDLWKEDPQLLPLGLLGVFGMGIQTYPKPENLKMLDKVKAQPDPGAAFEQLKEKDPKMAEKVQKAGLEAKYTDEDWKLKGKGVENGERAKAIASQLKDLKTKEEKVEYLKSLEGKKLMSDEVLKQVQYLMSKK